MEADSSNDEADVDADPISIRRLLAISIVPTPQPQDPDTVTLVGHVSNTCRLSKQTAWEVISAVVDIMFFELKERGRFVWPRFVRVKAKKVAAAPPRRVVNTRTKAIKWLKGKPATTTLELQPSAKLATALIG